MSQHLIRDLGLSAAQLLIKTDSDDTNKLILGALGAGAQLGVLLPYSRTHEHEADDVGLTYMWKAGYDPDAGARLWEKMAAQSRSGVPEFLSTHPAPEKRIENLRRLAAALKRQ